LETIVIESMQAPESPQHSVHSKTHRQIQRTLSNHVLPRKVDQSLRSFSGNDRKGRVQMTFLLSACKNSVAPDAAKMFYSDGKLSASFSRYFIFAMKYFDACTLASHAKDTEKTQFKDIEHYDKCLIAIRACQLLLFKNQNEQSIVQERVVLQLRTDLVSVHEVLRIYILLMSRKTQIAVWEGKYGLAAALLRRTWLDLITIRSVTEEQHSDMTLINELELFLEDITLKCGEVVEAKNKKKLIVYMADSSVQRHETKEIGAVLQIDHDGPRHELFEHCQELIYELPAKEVWGFKLCFHKSNHIMRIEQIKANSPADMVGLKIGDYVDEVGGDQLHEGGVEQAMEIIKTHKSTEDQSVEVVVYRELEEDVHIAAMHKKLAKHNSKKKNMSSR